MSEIFLLSTSVRMFIMIIMNIVAVLLIIDAALSYTLRDFKITRAVYLISLTVCVYVAIVSRTPLIIMPDVVLIAINCLLVVPITVALLLCIKEKKIVYFVDAVVLTLNLPTYFILFENWMYVYLISVGYMFVRAVVFSYVSFISLKKEPGRYTLKEAMDDLPFGLIFANDYDQVDYINNAMREYFRLADIEEYVLVSQIVERITELARIDGRKLSATSVMVKTQSKNLTFLWKLNASKIEQLVCRDATEEENMLAELESAKLKNEIMQTELKRAFGDITKLETEKEILRIKSNLHDVMAQRLSILHGIVSYDNAADLKEIKTLLQSMLPDMYETEKLTFEDKLDELISSFALIGVKLSVNGDLASLGHRSELTLKLLRECTTNSIRHGDATEVYASVYLGMDGFIFTVTDNGTAPASFREGNGISGMRYSVEAIGGKLNVKCESNRFVVSAIIPV